MNEENRGKLIVFAMWAAITGIVIVGLLLIDLLK